MVKVSIDTDTGDNTKWYSKLGMGGWETTFTSHNGKPEEAGERYWLGEIRKVWLEQVGPRERITRWHKEEGGVIGVVRGARVELNTSNIQKPQDLGFLESRPCHWGAASCSRWHSIWPNAVGLKRRSQGSMVASQSLRSSHDKIRWKWGISAGAVNPMYSDVFLPVWYWFSKMLKHLLMQLAELGSDPILVEVERRGEVRHMGLCLGALWKEGLSVTMYFHIVQAQWGYTLATVSPHGI